MSSFRTYLHRISLKKKKNLWDRSLLFTKSLYKKLKNVFAGSRNKTIAKLYLRTRHLTRKRYGNNPVFISIDELVIWTNEWLKSLPGDYDVIVGIPRSGLLIASIIALKLAKPLTTPELFIKEVIWASKKIQTGKKIRKVLLVDDTISSGKSMQKATQLLLSHCKEINLNKAALIIADKSKSLVDNYYEIIPEPRIFEWNMMHSKKGKTCFDMDGVLCENCPPGFDADEEKYTAWIDSAKPYLIPSYEIDAIISNRLEKYRTLTEKWLTRNRVKYKELILWDLQSKEERKNQYGKHKIDILLSIKPDIYFESSLNESEQIWKSTKIPTICIDEMIMFS